MMGTIQINSNTILRKVRLDDALAMFALIDSQREYLGRWLPFIPYTQTVDDSREFIESTLAVPADTGEIVLVIEVAGEFAGLIGLKDTDMVNLKTEIGYWIGEQYQGQGIVTKASYALCDLAFNAMGLNRVQIKAAVGNAKSSNIPKRLGFTFEGIERAGERTADGAFFDIEVYSLLKSEFK